VLKAIVLKGLLILESNDVGLQCWFVCFVSAQFTNGQNFTTVVVNEFTCAGLNLRLCAVATEYRRVSLSTQKII